MMFVAAGSLLFALVCPLAVTPMPVGKVKRLSDVATPAAVATPVLLAAEFHATFSPTSVSPEAPPADIPDLICVRTC